MTAAAEGPTGPTQFPSHLLAVDDLLPAQVDDIFSLATQYLDLLRQPTSKARTLAGKTVVNLFYESSTRTRTSFEMAGKRLSADVINMSVSGSSVTKGESLLDTCITLGAMRPHAVVFRHQAAGAAAFVARRLRIPVINGGDGRHEHPTQALLDAFVATRELGPLEGKTVALCGDLEHSRVARSDIRLFRKLGCTVRITGPNPLVPDELTHLGAERVPSIRDAVKQADVIIALRIQRERLTEALIPSLKEYAQIFGLSTELMHLAPAHAVLLHPGPINRGVEVTAAVADGPQSRILDQVEAGVAIRMAVLTLMLERRSSQ